MNSVVTELTNQGFRFERIDVRYRRQTVEKYRVRRVPTFVYVMNGKEVRRRSGNCSAGSLKMIFRKPLF